MSILPIIIREDCSTHVLLVLAGVPDPWGLPGHTFWKLSVLFTEESLTHWTDQCMSAVRRTTSGQKVSLPHLDFTWSSSMGVLTANLCCKSESIFLYYSTFNSHYESLKIIMVEKLLRTTNYKKLQGTWMILCPKCLAHAQGCCSSGYLEKILCSWSCLASVTSFLWEKGLFKSSPVSTCLNTLGIIKKVWWRGLWF